jgi:hypothetical protein
MGAPKVATPTDPMAGLASLAQMLGGTKTTQNAGNIDALQSALAGLKGQDGQALLASIFQQAGAQIPGLQTSLGNAIGARSGGNSAVAAALQKLMSQTTVTAQDQMQKQQLANLQAQGQIGANIAQATKGTTQQAGTNLGQAGKTLAILSLLSKSGLMGKEGNGGIFSKLTSSEQAPVSAPTGGALNGSSSQPASGGNFSSAPNFSSAATPSFLTNAGLSDPQFSGPGQSTVDLSSFNPYQPQESGVQDFISSFSNPTGPQSMVDTSVYNPYSAPMEPSFSPVDWAASAPSDWQPPTDWTAYADGGKVNAGAGAGAQKQQMMKASADEMEDSREGAVSKMLLKHMNEMGKMLLEHSKEDKTEESDEGFADGGPVRAGGSRRSANPTVDLTPVQRMSADNSRPAASRSSANIAPSVDFGGFMNSGGGSGNDSNGGLNSASTGANPGFGRALGLAANVNALSGITGGPAMPGNVLGTMAGLANAKSEKDALGVVGTAAANIAAPGLGSAVSVAMNPSLANGLNLAASFNPATAMANLGLGVMGMASLGEIAQNAIDLANPNLMMTPTQQMTVSTEQNNPNSAGLTSQANAMDGDALGNLMGLTDAFGTAPTSPADSYGDTSGGGGFGSSSTGANSGFGGDSSHGTAGYKQGGPIDGPGTGTSDSIKARLSDGEYVMSADTVAALGEEFFNQLQAAFHKPVARRA